MQRSCFILEGNGSSQNRGCEAIYRTTVEMLREEFGPCHLINAPAAIGDRPANVDADPNIVQLSPRPIIRWRPRWLLRKVYRKLLRREPEPTFPFTRYLKQANAVLSLGGDNFSLDYGRPDRFFAVAQAARRANRPFVIWGASVGPFSADPKYERFAVERLKRMSLICARESETVKYLESLSVTENVVQVADPAFLLAAKPAVIDPALEELLRERCVGMNLSPLVGRYRDNTAGWLADATEMIRAVLQRIDSPVVLIPHVLTPKSNDHGFLKHIYDLLGPQSGRLVLVSPQHPSDELKWIISRLHAFVGARTHATIAALSSCVPTLSIGYSVKSLGINRDIFGHSDFVLPVESLAPETLSDAITNLVQQHREVSGTLNRIMPDYRRRASEAASHLRRVIASPAA